PASRSTTEAEHECDGATGSETPQESLEPTGIAVDSNGEVYVSDRTHSVIDEFSPAGAYVGQISDPHIEKAGALSIAPDGDIYLLNINENIVKFSSAGAFLSSFGEIEPVSGESGKPLAMTVDPTNGHVYEADTYPATSIQEYGENEELLGSFGTEQLGSQHVLGLAVSRSTGDFLAAEELTEPGAAIYVFSPDLSAGAPTIKAEASWNTTSNSTELRAVVEPSDLATTCRLQYVDEEQFQAAGYAAATTVGCSPESFEPSFFSSPVSVQLAGLHLDTTYHYRFIAANSAAPEGVIGPDETFSTFGIQSFSVGAFGPAAEVDALAGSHPYELTTTFALPTTRVAGRGTGGEENPRDVEVELPPGLIGNPDAVVKCVPYDVAHADCSGASQVGVLTVATAGGKRTESPIYNLVPPAGVAAQFGARFNGYVTAHIDARVRTEGDYGVTADSLYVSSAEGLVGASVTLWGVPSDSRHDPERSCPGPGNINESHFPEAPYQTQPCTERGPPVPFLSNPTSCTGPRAASVRIDSWREPGTFVGASGEMPAITGCGKLDFKPTIAARPTSRASDSPSGLDVELKVPQNANSTGLAEAELEDAKVTLPAGVTVNPSSASGLVGCPLLSGRDSHVGQSGIDLENGEPANCPEASKVGRVTIETPLLERPLTGGVYVAQQTANPFKSLLALYVAAGEAERGVVVKLAGRVELNQTSGQLTTTFDENPQLPFESLKLDLFGGERAPLATPRTCGSYQPTALLEPFSHDGAGGEEGTPNAEPSIDPFEITSGPGGSACRESPFAPTFEAGTANALGGSFSPFTMTLRRVDGEQRFSTVSTTLPPGVAGMISRVAPCANAQAEAGDCPAASRIGHVTVEAGVGSEPVSLPQSGKPEDPVYLTEKYGGGPFGLSIVVPAEAGPFDLGTVVVRASITVDSRTGQVSVQSGSLPTILQGVPVDLRAINVMIDRPGFIFNPTDCRPLNVTGAITSAQGSAAAVSSRFQTASCATLGFKPVFKVATSAKTSRTNGASLSVKLSYPTAPQGTQANIKSVHVELPKALPSRLSTLNHACLDSVFNQNPANCPSQSRVGSAKAITPILPVPL
ncbi:MAG: hypothetical protein FWD42_08395, partial [Solirubrobacterales bacterium]|nr:hypothetical protein [Solirubrobacterales bacterium]